jgi:F420-dependent oxidoreductase-like protein
MTAMTLDHLSGGRFILGLGVSGPQVVEGWYGVDVPQTARPHAGVREILRRIWAREEPVAFDGDHYPLPYPGGTRLGKPLKITTHPLRADIPIYIGAEGPRNVEQTAEIADGWLPIFYSPEHSRAMYADALSAASEGFEVACPVTVVVDDDVQAAIDTVKMSLGFYIGGMGAKDANFHANVVSRMGFEEDARTIQELFLSDRREEAIKAVPDELADGIALCGPRERIAERLELWQASPVTTLLLGNRDPKVLRMMAELTT